MSEKRLAVASVAFDERVEALVLQVLRSGRIAQGVIVEAVESAVANVLGVSHVVAMNNGTSTLIAALHLLGVGRGDEVITSPFTFGATLNAILAVGATARFADIDGDDFNMSPTSVESIIGERTVALVPVHLFGQTADMTSLCAIAERHGLAVVEDAAQALGARHAGRSAGSFGVGSFSMYATKNVTSGEGGLLTTDDATLAAAARRFRNQGMDGGYMYESFGLNLRLTDVHAAIALPQLERLDQINADRVGNAARLSGALRGSEGLVPPPTLPANDHVFHQYTVRLDPLRHDRSTVKQQLALAGIDTAVYYPRLLFDYPYFAAAPGVVHDHCPVAAATTHQVLSLPVHQHLTASDVDRIADVVERALR